MGILFKDSGTQFDSKIVKILSGTESKIKNTAEINHC